MGKWIGRILGLAFLVTIFLGRFPWELKLVAHCENVSFNLPLGYWIEREEGTGKSLCGRADGEIVAASTFSGNHLNLKRMWAPSFTKLVANYALPEGEGITLRETGRSEAFRVGDLQVVEIRGKVDWSLSHFVHYLINDGRDNYYLLAYAVGGLSGALDNLNWTQETLKDLTISPYSVSNALVELSKTSRAAGKVANDGFNFFHNAPRGNGSYSFNVNTNYFTTSWKGGCLGVAVTPSKEVTQIEMKVGPSKMCAVATQIDFLVPAELVEESGSAWRISLEISKMLMAYAGVSQVEIDQYDLAIRTQEAKAWEAIKYYEGNGNPQEGYRILWYSAYAPLLVVYPEAWYPIALEAMVAYYARN